MRDLLHQGRPRGTWADAQGEGEGDEAGVGRALSSLDGEGGSSDEGRGSDVDGRQEGAESSDEDAEPARMVDPAMSIGQAEGAEGVGGGEGTRSEPADAEARKEQASTVDARSMLSTSTLSTLPARRTIFDPPVDFSRVPRRSLTAPVQAQDGTFRLPPSRNPYHVLAEAGAIDYPPSELGQYSNEPARVLHPPTSPSRLASLETPRRGSRSYSSVDKSPSADEFSEAGRLSSFVSLANRLGDESVQVAALTDRLYRRIARDLEPAAVARAERFLKTARFQVQGADGYFSEADLVELRTRQEALRASIEVLGGLNPEMQQELARLQARLDALEKAYSETKIRAAEEGVMSVMRDLRQLALGRAQSNESEARRKR